MTYCCGLLLRDGLVMIADTRTNAGVDNISVFRKLHTFEGPDRFVAVATAGNLSVTQSVLSVMQAGVHDPATDEVRSLLTAPDMFAAAQLLGDTVASIRKKIAAATEPDISADVTLLMGGQIAGQPMRFFLIYSEGNFFECLPDTPYLQAGETKYGKPILLRSVNYETDLYEALKVALVSFDSTLKSNLAVGMPIDLLVLRRDELSPELVHRIEVGDSYFHDLGERWSMALRNAIQDIPPVPYGDD
jgi:putative proteasome-type protease